MGSVVFVLGEMNTPFILEKMEKTGLYIVFVQVFVDGKSPVGAQEGIVAEFAFDGGGGAVAGEDVGGGGQGFEAGEGMFDVGDIAAGEVSAADAAGEENVAAEEDVLGFEMEGDAAGAVAGQEQNSGLQFTYRDHILLVDEGIDRRQRLELHAVHHRLHGRGLIELHIVFVHVDGRVGFGFDFG